MVSTGEKNTHGLADGCFQSEKSNSVYNKANSRASLPNAKGDAPETKGRVCSFTTGQRQRQDRGTGNNAVNFNELPQKALVRVMEFLRGRDRGAAAAVSRNWHKAATHSSVRRVLSFCRTCVDRVCRVLRSAPLLETVSFVRIPDVATAVRQLCRSNPSVKHVIIRDCSPTDEKIPEAVLINLLMSCPNLQTLDLCGTKFKLHRLYQELWRVPNLKKLDVGCDQFLRPQDLNAIAFSCRDLRVLRLTDGTSGSFSDQDAASLIMALHHSLVELAMNMHGLSDATFQAVLQCQKLRWLSMDNALFLYGELFEAIADRIPLLEGLEVRHACQLCSDDFIEAFSVLRNVKHLDVSGCWRLGDDGMVAIADSCASELQYLALRSCKAVTNQGMEDVAIRCPNITHLDIAHAVKIDATFIERIPELLPKLRTLIVENDLEKAEVIQELTTSMQALTVKISMSEYTNVLLTLN